MLAGAASDQQRIERILAQTPLIDGHNDPPRQLRARFGADFSKVDLVHATPGPPAAENAPLLMTHSPACAPDTSAPHPRGAGVEHVGLGSDFEGIPDAPKGLDGGDKFPALLAEFARRGWSDVDLSQLAGANVLRVLTQVGEVSRHLQASQTPSRATLAEFDGAVPAAMHCGRVHRAAGCDAGFGVAVFVGRVEAGPGRSSCKYGWFTGRLGSTCKEIQA